MRVVVTGGAGFIGGHLAAACLEAGHQVGVLDNLSTGVYSNVPAGAAVHQVDVRDLDAVEEVLEGSEVVFHLAASRSVLRSVENPIATDRANTLGTLNVLVAAARVGVRRVVVASSSSVYGGQAPRPTPEDAPLVPRSPYAVSKLAAEQYARVFAELQPLETVALRFFNVFGPRQRPEDPYAGVIPLFIEALRTGRPVTIHGDGEQSRDFTYVSDVVAATLGAGIVDGRVVSGRVYNIARGEETTLLGLVDMISQVLGVEAQLVHTDARPGDARHSRADISAAVADLAYQPAVALLEGLARTVEWTLQRP
ncbi:MAG TPA: NAD-dependent epimerase/dehydratase family protein [Acidimicrobiales bacterium]|nr:NAD-dependent epimerase/dehydratase family protein [Acidimicrobiales bacterium]